MVMHPGSASGRDYQKSALASIFHQKKTSNELTALLEALRPQVSELSSYKTRAVFRGALRDHTHEICKTPEMAKLDAILQSGAFAAWQAKRGSSDFITFAPLLTRVTKPHAICVLYATLIYYSL